jgi:hypothetical protein
MGQWICADPAATVPGHSALRPRAVRCGPKLRPAELEIVKDTADFAARAGHSISWKPTLEKNRNKSKKILNKVILAY